MDRYRTLRQAPGKDLSDRGDGSLKFMKLIPLNAKINCTSANMDLLFNSDKLLKLITLISSKSNNSTLKTIGSLANSYDGMMLGFTLKKE